MDEVKISSPFDSFVGSKLWIPFNCIRIQFDGRCVRTLAKDLPIFASQTEVLTFLTNNPGLACRALDWIEYSNKDILRIPELKEFVKNTFLKSPGTFQ